MRARDLLPQLTHIRGLPGAYRIHLTIDFGWQMPRMHYISALPPRKTDIREHPRDVRQVQEADLI